MSDISLNVIKIFVLGVVSFVLAFWLAPLLTNFLYKNKLWKKRVREKTIDKKDLTIFKKFHSEGEVNIPRFGGLLIWVTTLFLIIFFFLVSKITNIGWLNKLNFLSRTQTWLPIFALISASILGLVDDALPRHIRTCARESEANGPEQALAQRRGGLGFEDDGLANVLGDADDAFGDVDGESTNT